jgi:subtilisin family serine protease
VSTLLACQDCLGPLDFNGANGARDVGRVSREDVEAVLVFRHPLGTRSGAAHWRGVLVALATALLLGLFATATLAAVPNDPFFARQWGASNSGQPIPTQGPNEVLGGEVAGAPAADERALEAWGVTSGSRSIVIGETDTGVDYTHPDLAANIWSNPGTIGGCGAGTHGYNVLTKACNPIDEETLADGGYGGHGTHVAGILGAVGNNGLGVAGVNWQTTILPVKWLQTANSANETEHLVEALKWLVQAQEAGVNVRVVNDSPTFKGSGPSPELEHEIKVLGEHQILFVTSAGNDGSNDDAANVLRYPCKYRLPNEICVTASNNEDQLPSWANTGRETVNLAAPGVSIYSTIRGGEYRYLSGGSMAAAQVSGAAALILAAKPSLSVGEVKAAILNNVDALPALAGKVATGGRLDIAKALPALVSEVSPGGGPAAGGTQVTIAGANLARARGVTFGSANAAFTVNSPSSITATAPAGSGTVDVRVIAPGGASAPVPGDRYTYVPPPPPPPAVTGVSPSSGPQAGGTSVTIAGSNLGGTSAVEFGSNSAASFTVSSSTSITATAPPGSGTVDVIVTTPAGSSPAAQADHFTYASEPPPSEPPPSEPPLPETPPEPSTPPTSTAQTSTPQTSLPGATLTSGGGAVLGISNATSALALVSSTLTVRHRRAVVGLRCTGPRNCRGKMTLAIGLATRKDSGIVGVRWLTIGRVAFDVLAARTAMVLVTLSTTGLHRLSVGRGSLGAMLAIVSSPPTQTSVRAKHVRLLERIAGVRSSGR